MKYLFVLTLLLITSCQHHSKNNRHLYYSSPELTGMVFFNGNTVSDANIILLTTCSDKYTITDETGYFSLGPACVELIPQVPKTDLGYFYQLIILIGDQQFRWQVGGLGYGFKSANVEIDLANKVVNYQINEGENIKNGVSPLDYNNEDSSK